MKKNKLLNEIREQISPEIRDKVINSVTLENNKLIAEFMVVDLIDGQEGEYHTSWEWLMPVVEKIESLGYWVDRDLGDVTIVDGTYTIIIPTPMSEGGKDMYYKAVVEFIKWYNENKNQKR